MAALGASTFDDAASQFSKASSTKRKYEYRSNSIWSDPDRENDRPRVSQGSGMSPAFSNNEGAEEATFGNRSTASLIEQHIHRSASGREELYYDNRKPYFQGLRRCIILSHSIVDNKWFIIVTTIFTVYALIGDDMRLLTTSKPADIYFDTVVLVCIAVFSIEVALSCLGKEDYFMGFFFMLDIISTLSLVLDLSFVADSDMVAGSSDEDDQISSLRGGKTARAGARAGRVVRVLRLVRILKLYKAFYETRKKRRDMEGKDDAPGDDESDCSDLQTKPESYLDPNETRVGKKLSETTIRSVIVLVLIMLLVLPFLNPTDAVVASSAQYGADHSWGTFTTYVADRSTYEVYAYEFLDFIYYHNWFSIDAEYCSSRKCANTYYARLFWFGVMGKADSSPLVDEWATLAKLNESSVNSWVASNSHQSSLYNYGTMPRSVVQKLFSTWTPGCNTENQVRWGVSLLDEEIDGLNSYRVKCPEDLRRVERRPIKPRVLSINQLEERSLCFYFDLRPYVRLGAGYNLTVTSFICALLCGASLYFSRDANRLVLSPVENMIQRVEAIRADPLVAMKMADEEVQMEDLARAKLIKKKQRTLMLDMRTDPLAVIFRTFERVHDLLSCEGKKCVEPMETVILEKTIIKLGALMALGFGEAGANIIGRNMRGSESAGANAMISGVRTECIIGIARIRDFAVAAEVLQEKTNTFVNQIAEIVHGVVTEFQGAPNKNNGDTFMIIWRTMANEDAKQNRFSDLAVLAFTKILGHTHRSWMLAEYRAHPGLQQRLGSNFRVQLSLGLHFGWAIEGAVGSEFKIEASYLSPHVSMANTIEEATHFYGVPFIVSQAVLERCTEEMANKCRLIDRVIATGSQQALRLFSMDVDHRSLSVDRRPTSNKMWTSRNRFKARQFIDNEKSIKMRPETEIAALFDADHYISRMRRSYTEEFLQLFNMGYQNYAEGEWAVARRMFLDTQSMLGWPDGPSMALLNFMDSFSFESPKDWRGVRTIH